MAVSPTLGHGAVVKIGDGATPTEAFTAISHIISGPTGPNFTPRIQEAVHHGSVGVIRKAKIVDAGTVSFEILFDSDDAQHQALEAAAMNPEPVNFELILSDTGARKYAFAAFVRFEVQTSPEGWNQATVELTIDGEVQES